MRTHSLTRQDIAVAERHALWQRVLLYPAVQRLEVIRRNAAGIDDAHIARELQMPLNDVRAIADAFVQIPHRLS